MDGKLVVMKDPVADALDDMAALGQHWTRNRERGRMSSGIRAAMLLVAREALAHEDAAERALARQFNDLCGPAAFARTTADKVLNCGPKGECLYCGVACDEPCSRYVPRINAETACMRMKTHNTK